MLREVLADAVEVFGDSMLVINQLAESFECRSEVLITYHERSLLANAVEVFLMLLKSFALQSSFLCFSQPL